MSNHQSRRFLLAVSIMLCLNVSGQNDKDLGSWNGFGLKFELSEKLDVYAESRIRAYAFYDKFYYFEYTMRLSYSLSRMISVAAGTGRHQTYSSEGNFMKPLESGEMRIYEEITEKHSFSRFYFDNRIRIDQRFTTDGYMNRYRFKPGCSIPLNHATITPGTIFLSFWDEIFIVAEKPHLDLNRFYAGANYKFENLTIQSGWANQVSNDDLEKTRKNFFLIAFLVDIDLKKKQ